MNRVDAVILRLLDLASLRFVYPLVEGVPHCCATSPAQPGFGCTREKHHTGLHVAHVTDGSVIAVWENVYDTTP